MRKETWGRIFSSKDGKKPIQVCNQGALKEVPARQDSFNHAFFAPCLQGHPVSGGKKEASFLSRPRTFAV